ncbi:hypothetical protein VO57_008780 [Citromicrobium bathyomarinum]|nr:hypothetical protein [Citromicrobium sp. JL2201]KPM22269.1 hypothetical protein VO57_12535 [Citromicrobium sp. JL2201]
MNALPFLNALLGVGKWLLSGLWKLLGKLFDWLLADFRHVVIAVFGALWLWGLLITVPGLRTDVATQTARADREAMLAETWRVSAEDWERGYTEFVQLVMAAQIDAAEADRANIARVEAEFAAINERTADDYEARLAGSAAAAERLRDRLARAEADSALAGGSLGGDAGEPVDLTARCQAFGAADCDGLLQQLPWVLAEAQANTDKLVPLQQWVASSALIDFSGNAEEPAQ